MLTRICYALVMAWRYRKMLKAYRTESALQAAKVVILDPVLLKAEGIKVLVIDVDGVLTSFGELIVTKEIESWLNSCVSIMGEGRVVVLTNKPTTERSQYYANTFKGIQLVQARRKKPYPDGLQQIMLQAKVKPEEVLMIDDRLLTGILAALIAKTKGCYITDPTICIKKHPLPELFFIVLRKIERLVI